MSAHFETSEFFLGSPKSYLYAYDDFLAQTNFFLLIVFFSMVLYPRFNYFYTWNHHVLYVNCKRWAFFSSMLSNLALYAHEVEEGFDNIVDVSHISIFNILLQLLLIETVGGISGKYWRLCKDGCVLYGVIEVVILFQYWLIVFLRCIFGPPFVNICSV